MNTGQMMLTLGALMILALIVLRVNNGFLTTNSTLLDSKLGVLATSVATSVIEEATGKAFDHNSDSTSISDLTKLTSTMGPETGETYPDFNDFDDYDGFHKVDNSMPSAEFHIDCVVNYISDTNLDGKSSSRTWHKKLTVFVSSPSMLGQDDVPDTISMSAVYSYWYFR
jgi:MSHA pilin protein MshD